MKKLKKDDKVVAIAGNDKGQTGTILSFKGTKGDKVVVQGLNVKKKHVKKQGQQPGRIMDIEAPIHISNLAAADEDGNPVKLKVSMDGKGSKDLVYTKDGKQVLYRSVKKTT
jgi:large subunit ribosomal protein L24